MALERDEFLEHMRLLREDIREVHQDVKTGAVVTAGHTTELALLKVAVAHVEAVERGRRRSWMALAGGVASAVATALVEYFTHGPHPHP